MLIPIKREVNERTFIPAQLAGAAGTGVLPYQSALKVFYLHLADRMIKEGVSATAAIDILNEAKINHNQKITELMIHLLRKNPKLVLRRGDHERPISFTSIGAFEPAVD